MHMDVIWRCDLCVLFVILVTLHSMQVTICDNKTLAVKTRVLNQLMRTCQVGECGEKTFIVLIHMIVGQSRIAHGVRSTENQNKLYGDDVVIQLASSKHI